MRYKRQRGQRRRWRALLRAIREWTPSFVAAGGYEHFHVPSGPFISSPKTGGGIKMAFCRAWLERTAEIIAQKPSDLSFCRVVAFIDAGDLWASQIVIFYDEEYYRSFWTRDREYQRWEVIADEKISFARRRGLKTDLAERGYWEIVSDGDGEKKSELWFYGEI